MRKHQEKLARELSDRHVQLIAIGGAIGVGLFLGSAAAIQTAGPSLILSYAIGGLIIFFMMRALGELAIHQPVAGSFATYASEFIGSWAGFITGWTYWFIWVVSGMAEITAVGVYTRFWFPQIPQWIPALIALIFVYLINLIAVRLFGEFEFWFALIKIVTILALISIGLIIITTGLGNNGQPIGISNLWSHGGFMPNGILGVFLAMQMVMFAFLGVELVGITAGEAKNPDQTIPSAINKILWRILIFYIGALTVIMSLYPWNELDGKTSPFVLTFEKIGIPAAAGIINFVVMTAALSSCNSGIFSTGRMLFTLAENRQAPKFLGTVNKNKVPAWGITATAFVLLIGVLLNYVIPEQAFAYISSVATIGALWVWSVVAYAHIKFRKKHPNLSSKFPMPGYPYTNWLVILFMIFVAILLAFNENTRISLIVGPIWFGILAISYAIWKARYGSPPTSPFEK